MINKEYKYSIIVSFFFIIVYFFGYIFTFLFDNDFAILKGFFYSYFFITIFFIFYHILSFKKRKWYDHILILIMILILVYSLNFGASESYYEAVWRVDLNTFSIIKYVKEGYPDVTQKTTYWHIYLMCYSGFIMLLISYLCYVIDCYYQKHKRFQKH